MGKVISAEVVSAEQEGRVLLRLNDGSTLRARVEEGVTLPAPGEKLKLQVAELQGRDGLPRLRLMEPDAQTAQAKADVLPQQQGEALLSGMSGLPPKLTDALKALVESLVSMKLPVTEQNLAAMEEVAAAPKQPMPLESVVGASRVLTEGSVQGNSTEIPPVRLVPSAAESIELPSAQSPDGESAVSEGVTAVITRASPRTGQIAEYRTVPPEVSDTSQAAEEQQQADAVNSSGSARGAGYSRSAQAVKAAEQATATGVTGAAQSAGNAGPSANVTGEQQSVTGTVQNSTAREASAEQMRDTAVAQEEARQTSLEHIRQEVAKNPSAAQSVTAADVAKIAAKLTNGPAIRQSIIDLPKRLEELEQRIEREIAAVARDNPKFDDLKFRYNTVHTIRETMEGSRLPESRYVYAQVPLQIDNFRTTAEVYVYKNPKLGRSRIDPENAKILLSLDLEYQGNVEALINVRGKELSLTFGAENKDTVNTLRHESIALYPAMREVGFKLTSVTSSLMPSKSTPDTAMLKLLASANESSGGFDIIA